MDTPQQVRIKRALRRLGWRAAPTTRVQRAKNADAVAACAADLGIKPSTVRSWLRYESPRVQP